MDFSRVTQEALLLVDDSREHNSRSVRQEVINVDAIIFI